jgi:hypothetical protein
MCYDDKTSTELGNSDHLHPASAFAHLDRRFAKNLDVKVNLKHPCLKTLKMMLLWDSMYGCRGFSDIM